MQMSSRDANHVNSQTAGSQGTMNSTPVSPPLYPLRFRPALRRYIWGGRRLGTVLCKELGPGDDYAESWEVVDHGADQSVVSQGVLAGKTLGAIASEHGSQLYGRHHPQPSFPLLFKFLDANRNLSVQVHPNDQQAALSSWMRCRAASFMPD
jgi:mannose-6-phosphate isomerase